MKLAVISGFSILDEIGGSEFQNHLILKNLPREKYKSNYVILKGGKNSSRDEEFEGVYYSRLKGTNQLNIFVKLINKIKSLNPDVIYTRDRRYLFVIFLVSRLCNIPIIYHHAFIPENHNSFFDVLKYSISNILKGSHKHFFISFLAGISKPDMTLVLQNAYSSFVKDRYGDSAKLQYNGHEIGRLKNLKLVKQKIVIWVNNIKDFKRPELFLKLFLRLKDKGYHFVMIGRDTPKYSEILRLMNKNYSNFTYTGELSPEEVNNYLEKSAIFVLTSTHEGLNNSFIQASLRRNAIISTFDPDGILKKNSMGFFCNNFDTIVKKVNYLFDNPAVLLEMQKNNQKFSSKFFDILEVVKRYEIIFSRFAK